VPVTIVVLRQLISSLITMTTQQQQQQPSPVFCYFTDSSQRTTEAHSMAVIRVILHHLPADQLVLTAAAAAVAVTSAVTVGCVPTAANSAHTSTSLYVSRLYESPLSLAITVAETQLFHNILHHHHRHHHHRHF